MIQKDGSIVLENFEKGMAPSPNLGFGLMKTVDISSVPGAILPNFVTAQGVAAAKAEIKYMSFGTTRTVAVGANYSPRTSATVWIYTSGSWAEDTTSGSAGTGNGLIYWKGYHLIFGNTQADAIQDSSGTWTTNFASGMTSVGHYALHAQNDKVYICNDRYVASLTENTTFVPGTGATFTFSATALDLPSGWVATELHELGQNLIVVGVNTTTGQIGFFPWDYVSPSFRLPAYLASRTYHSGVVANNILYFMAGMKPVIYAYDGSQIRIVKRLPFDYRTGSGGITSTNPGTMVATGDRIYFGISGNNSSSTMRNFAAGIYSMNLENGAISMEFEAESGEIGANNDLRITMLRYRGENQSPSFHFGIFDNVETGTAEYSIEGVDATATSRATGYKAYFDSPLHVVGTEYGDKTYQFADVYFDVALASGDGIKIYYRDSYDDAFTLITTVDFATHGAKSQITVPCLIPKLEQVQIRVELTQNARLRKLVIR